jgi:hypothetical protein
MIRRIKSGKCSIDIRWMEFENFKEDTYDSYLLFINRYNRLPELSDAEYYSKQTCSWINPKRNKNDHEYILSVAPDILERMF